MPLVIGAVIVGASGIWAGFALSDGFEKLKYLLVIGLILYIAYKFKG